MKTILVVLVVVIVGAGTDNETEMQFVRWENPIAIYHQQHRDMQQCATWVIDVSRFYALGWLLTTMMVGDIGN